MEKLGIHDLGDALINQSPLRMQVGLLASKARGAVDRKKLEIQIYESEKYIELRSKYRRTDEKVTEAEVNARIKTGSDWLDLHKELNEAEQQSRDAQTLCTAFDQRRDTIVQLSKQQLANTK